MKKLLVTLSSLSLIAIAAPAFAGTTEAPKDPAVKAEKVEAKVVDTKVDTKVEAAPATTAAPASKKNVKKATTDEAKPVEKKVQ